MKEEFYNKAAEWLRNEIGLEVESIGISMLEASIDKTLRNTTINANEGFDVSIQSENFREELLENTIVPETWFFRDKQSYELLDSCIKEFTGRKMRILSAPCSTGEEPYSVAITLAENGLLGLNSEVVAVDISQKSIDKAKDAVYSSHSFRNFNFEKWGKYFEQEGKLFKVKDIIKDYIGFHRFNLIDSEFPYRFGKFHAIFSKNILIYLTQEARVTYIENLKKLLYPEGTLFCGLSEVNCFLQNGFEKVSHRHAFACRIKDNTSPKFVGLKNEFPDFKSAKEGNIRFATGKHNLLHKKEAVKHSLTKNEPALMLSDNVEDIKLYADQGKFSEALEKCRVYSLTNPSAEIFYLGGVVCEALNQFGEAETWYLKAVYLDPIHYETLLNLALYYEKSGNLTQSELYRIRAQKAFANRSNV